MQNLPFLYENLPANLKTQAFEILEFWAFQGHLSIPKHASFVEILPLLPEKLRNDLADYLRFLESKIEKTINAEEKAAKAHLLAQKVLQELDKMPKESIDSLKTELKKMIPQADSTVMLKIGSGAYEEERETSVGIFIGVQNVQTAETIDLESYFTEVFRLAHIEKLEVLEEVLAEFEAEAEPEFWLTSIPASKIDEGLYGLHFSLRARLILTEKEYEEA